MTRYQFQLVVKSIIIWLIMLFPNTSLIAQEPPIKIVINDSLTNNSEYFSIKTGALKKYRFGDYKVVEKKIGLTSTGNITKKERVILNVKTDHVSKTRSKFSFTLTNDKSDSAFVKAEYIELSQYLVTEDRFLKILSILGENSDIEAHTISDQSDTSILKATIVNSSNLNNIWTLLLTNGNLGRSVDGQLEGSISNGERTIYITKVDYDLKNRIKVFSYSENDSISFPRLRYEFIENRQSLGAVKYEGNLNCSIWFNLELEQQPELKLMLASVMISILQIQLL
ncbi:hypothetical protein [Algoriphagus persicinus]|uniref:hypothetical protein n=1 Tax=Algoriphagus persicinus TaxID=3108754 RepID=UPI002B3CC98B|nr:hypothetical protein [Algoriphagus sp. E1-3-M2]MEB2784952.1 hypothetical protein [Algoriphagus sp. E1-3-M2]